METGFTVPVDAAAERCDLFRGSDLDQIGHDLRRKVGIRRADVIRVIGVERRSGFQRIPDNPGQPVVFGAFGLGGLMGLDQTGGAVGRDGARSGCPKRRHVGDDVGPVYIRILFLAHEPDGVRRRAFEDIVVIIRW